MGLLGHDIHCIVNSTWSRRTQWNNLQTRLSTHKDSLNEKHFTMKQIQQTLGKISFICKRKILNCRLTDQVQNSEKGFILYTSNSCSTWAQRREQSGGGLCLQAWIDSQLWCPNPKGFFLRKPGVIFPVFSAKPGVVPPCSADHHCTYRKQVKGWITPCKKSSIFFPTWNICSVRLNYFIFRKLW